MKKLRVLLTGDDGYTSIGIRLLIYYLRDDYDLVVCATKTQQSAVGGKLSVQHGGTWKETTVDGIQAFCIDGTPSDAVECAHSIFKEGFDLVLSGMNLGENIGIGVVASGTVSAAQRAMTFQLAPHALSLSWVTPPEFFYKTHDELEDITGYRKYPGKALAEVVRLAIANDYWGASMLNINLPKNPTMNVRFTRFMYNSDDCYPPARVRDDGTFAYPFEEGKREEKDPMYDVAALAQGYISITPQTHDWTNEHVFSKVKDTLLQLE